MKKTYLSLLAFSFSFQFARAQWTNGTDIYNTNTGNVGIGTQTPASKLDVDGTLTLRSGSVAINSIIPNVNVNGNTRTMRFNYNSNSGSEGFQFYNSNSSSNLLMITGSGKVGIGTQNPVNRLHISSNQTHTTQTIDVLRNGSTYGNATLLFGAPRSDSADGGTASGRGMIRVDGNPNDNISTMYIGANTSGLSGTVDMDTRQSYLKIVGTSLNAPSSYFEYKSGSTSIMRVRGDGKVGIGTTTPTDNLHIVSTNGGISITNTGHYGLRLYNLGDNTEKMHLYWRSSDDVIALNTGASPGRDLSFITGVAESIRVKASGNVGIGTSTPDTKLAVNGVIHSKEVKVDLIGWPDYVFKPSYKLPTLAEVKQHIDQKGYLPGMPSAQEVEQNGAMLGEMNKLLVKKVEELTLYLLQKEEQLKAQEERLKKLENIILKKD